MKYTPSCSHHFAFSASALICLGAVACGGEAPPQEEGASGGTAATLDGVGGSASSSGGSGSSSGGGPTNGEYAGESCNASERVGYFVTYLSEDTTLVEGSVATVVSPAAIAEVLAEEGYCQLLGPRDLFCSTDCDGDTPVCAGDDVCVAKRTSMDAGEVTLEGLSAPFSFEPNQLTMKYTGRIDEPFPGFDAGALVHLSTAGGVFEKMDFDVWGVAALTTDMKDVAVQSDESVSLSWDVDNVNTSQSEMHVKFTINSHGALTGWIECIAPDTGNLEIPAALITDLMTKGLSGFPRMKMTRRSMDRVDSSAGCVDFSVQTVVGVDLVVDGVVSCNGDTPCPSGERCREPEKFCEPE